MPMRKIRVLIVDDSILFRTTMEQRLGKDAIIEIVGTACDAMEARTKIDSLHPDVLTLDVEMPKMNGIDFLKQLMPQHPMPVVVVSSLPITTLDALSAGAVDFVKKPAVQTPADLDAFIRELALKVKIASTARVAKKPLTQTLASNARTGTLTHAPSQKAVIAIGASTGGTEAILAVVRKLPANSPGVVIVQHMPAVFTKMYAERLDKLCAMRVKEAEHGDRVVPGTIIVAAGEFHMKLASDARGYYITSQRGEKVNGHCPSVEVLFHSVATVAGRNAVGVILTGMGADGAKGLLAMRKAGAYTIGQDEESCVVYGMPMVAFNIGAVQKQLPLGQICGEIIDRVNKI